MANFSQLPEELIELCMKRLTYIDDCVRFGAACKSWRSVLVAIRQRPSSYCSPPWLMITDDDDDADNFRSFSCLSGEREVHIELPDIQGRRCWGSPFGWLVTFGLDYSIHLLNPFSGVRLPLPHQSTFPTQFPVECLETERENMRLFCPVRFVLSSNPSLVLAPDSNQNQSFFVIAISNPDRKLSFAKLGDAAWSPMETSNCCSFDDAIYFKGQVYAIDHRKGFLTVVDIDAPHLIRYKTIESTAPHTFRINTRDKAYLVEMFGELLLLVRYYDDMQDKFITMHFYIYKFHFPTESWMEVSDLGDHTLFVGSNSPFIISTNDYPEFKRNAIYYTDDNASNLIGVGVCDMSVYDFGKKTIEPFFTDIIEPSTFSPPVFIVPSL